LFYPYDKNLILPYWRFQLDLKSGTKGMAIYKGFKPQFM